MVALRDNVETSHKMHTLTEGDVSSPSFIEQLEGNDEKSIWHAEYRLKGQKLLERNQPLCVLSE